MKPDDFDLLSGLLKERSGLALSPDKTYLLESRLGPLAQRRGMSGIDDLVKAIRAARDGPLMQDVVEAMTTNESFFFRDTKPFERFREGVLPALLEARADKKRLRIWCAAASSGQEPYSIAMLLREEAAKLGSYRVEIVATDIDTEVLEKAKTGVYTQFEVQRGLPVQMLVKYFSKDGDMWQIDSAVRGMVDFRKHNLLDDASRLGAFDVVFCRNVLIYFDRPLKTEVLGRIAQLMPADGYLFLGGAETVIGLETPFVPMQGERGIYRPVDRTSH